MLLIIGNIEHNVQEFGTSQEKKDTSASLRMKKSTRIFLRRRSYSRISQRSRWIRDYGRILNCACCLGSTFTLSLPATLASAMFIFLAARPKTLNAMFRCLPEYV